MVVVVTPPAAVVPVAGLAVVAVVAAPVLGAIATPVEAAASDVLDDALRQLCKLGKIKSQTLNLKMTRNIPCIRISANGKCLGISRSASVVF